MGFEPVESCKSKSVWERERERERGKKEKENERDTHMKPLFWEKGKGLSKEKRDTDKSPKVHPVFKCWTPVYFKCRLDFFLIFFLKY